MSMVAASFPLHRKGREGSVFFSSMRNSLLLLGAWLPSELLQRGICLLRGHPGFSPALNGVQSTLWVPF